MHPRTGAGDVHIGGGEDGRHLVAECEIIVRKKKPKMK